MACPASVTAPHFLGTGSLVLKSLHALASDRYGEASVCGVGISVVVPVSLTQWLSAAEPWALSAPPECCPGTRHPFRDWSLDVAQGWAPGMRGADLPGPGSRWARAPPHISSPLGPTCG